MSKPSSFFHASQHVSKLVVSSSSRRSPVIATSSRCLATVRSGNQLNDVWFTAAGPRRLYEGHGRDPQRPKAERTVKLGKTLRILQERLPTLLQSPLPSEILSPQISLHLFPSTHPHLPTVSGRVGYVAALWTSPIAWGRVPIVGNVRLRILSERMVKTSLHGYNTAEFHPRSRARAEQLVVRWQTCGKTKGRGVGGGYKGISGSEKESEQVDKITEFLGGGRGEDDTKEFTGLFIFEFDEEGRVLNHTIEHVQEGGNWDKGVGARVVGLTDWLLGGMRGRGDTGTPCPAYWADEECIDRRLRGRS